MAGAKRGCLFVVTLVVVLAAVVASAGAWFFYQQTRFADADHPDRRERGHRQRRAANSAAKRDAGVDEGQDAQWQLARQLDAAGKLKVGEYALSGELTPRELLLRMRRQGAAAPRHDCRGLEHRQLRAALKRAEPLLHTTDTLDDAALMQRLGFGGQHPEGRFPPETYVCAATATRTCSSAPTPQWKRRWTRPGKPRAGPADQHAYELLTLASIIERKPRWPASARRLPGAAA